MILKISKILFHDVSFICHKKLHLFEFAYVLQKILLEKWSHLKYKCENL